MTIYNLVYGIKESGPTPEPWQPGANTLGYYPLNGDLKDYSGNNRDLTGSGVTYTSGGPGQVAVFGTSTTAYRTDNALYNRSYPFTFSIYIQTQTVPTGYYSGGRPNLIAVMSITNGSNLASWDKGLCFGLGGVIGYNYYNGEKIVSGGSVNTNTWYYLVYTFDGSTQKIYINGSLAGTNACRGSYTGFSSATLRLALQRNEGGMQYFSGKMSNVIIENKARTDQEISDYYNATKSNYGL